MNESVSDHLVLSLEAFAAFASRTAFNSTVMRPILGMDVRVGIQEVLFLLVFCHANRIFHKQTCVWKG